VAKIIETFTGYLNIGERGLLCSFRCHCCIPLIVHTFDLQDRVNRQRCDGRAVSLVFDVNEKCQVKARLGALV
jgi:hypothetical protein